MLPTFTAFSLASLKAELTNDPKHLGYAALNTAGNLAQIVTLLTESVGPGTGQVANDPITGSALLGLLNPTELDAQSVSVKQTLALYTPASSVKIGSDAFLNWITGQFTVGASPLSNAALLAASVRTGSRAEVLWAAGANTNINQETVQNAYAS